jgi:hypothetical protein
MFISLSAHKFSLYESAPAIRTFRRALKCLYSYLKSNIKVWSTAEHVKGASSTDISVKIQPHIFVHGIVFVYGHIN